MAPPSNSGVTHKDQNGSKRAAKAVRKADAASTGGGKSISEDDAEMIPVPVGTEEVLFPSDSDNEHRHKITPAKHPNSNGEKQIFTIEYLLLNL